MIKDIENSGSLDKNLLQAYFLKAEGGIALRLGNDLILWREENALQIKAAGTFSLKQMDIRKNHFSN